VAERLDAVDRTAAAGGKEAAVALIPFLGDRDLTVRNQAVRRLVSLGDDAVEPLALRLGDEGTRWGVSTALVNIGAPAIPRVALILTNPDTAARRNALFVLRQLDARDASPEIERTLSDPDATVRIMAIQTLAQFGGERNLAIVLRGAEDRSPAVRDAAIDALTLFGAAGVPSLGSLLQYGDPEVRASAVRVLGLVATPEALEIARRALSDPSPPVRYYALLALGGGGDRGSVSAILERFEDPDANVRDAASDAAALLVDDAAPTLYRQLRQGSNLQKIGAATTIRKGRYRPGLPAVEEAMRDPAAEVRVAAVAAIMEIADPGSVDILINGLKDPEIRWICVMSLRQVGETNLGPLLKRTGDADLDYWKQYVLDGMGNRVIDGCIESLKEKGADEKTKMATLCTMKQIRDVRAVFPLIELLSDDRLGYVASHVLAQMGEVAVEPLLFSISDENPAVRARAAAALGEIGADRVVKPLKALLADKDPQVRITADQAMKKISGEVRRISGENAPAYAPAQGE
jgi:HEAT repeat protein